MENVETIKTPLGIKIISILVILIYPIIYFTSTSQITYKYLSHLDVSSNLINIIPLAVLFFIFLFLGFKLWKGKNYARIIIIILSFIAPFLWGIIGELLPSPVFIMTPPGAPPSIPPSIFKIILYFTPFVIPFYLIAAYLLFSKKVKLFFNNKK